MLKVWIQLMMLVSLVFHAISLFNSIDCEFSDNHMKMFTQFVHDNDFPCLQTIDISRMN